MSAPVSPLVSRRAWIDAYLRLHAKVNFSATMVGDQTLDMELVPPDMLEHLAAFDEAAKRIVEICDRELLALESARDWP